MKSDDEDVGLKPSMYAKEIMTTAFSVVAGENWYWSSPPPVLSLVPVIAHRQCSASPDLNSEITFYGILSAQWTTVRGRILSNDDPLHRLVVLQHQVTSRLPFSWRLFIQTRRGSRISTQLVPLFLRSLDSFQTLNATQTLTHLQHIPEGPTKKNTGRYL